MTSANKATSPEVAVPQSVEEAGNLMRQLQLLQQRLETIPLKRDKEVADIKENAKVQTKEIKEQMAPLIKALVSFAQARRAELTEGDDKKTVTIAPGRLRWRFTPKSIGIARGKLADVIATIKANLRRYGLFRIQPEIKLNKRAMLEKSERALEIPGVSIAQSEVLVIELDDVSKRVLQKLRVLTATEMAEVPTDLIEAGPEEEGEQEGES